MGLGNPNLVSSLPYPFPVFLSGHLSSFPLPKTFSSCSEFAQQLLIHPWMPPGIFAPVPPASNASLLSLEEGILDIQPHSWAPLSSAPLSSGTLSSTSLKSPKSALSSPGQGVPWVTRSLSRGSPAPTSRAHCSQGCLGASRSPPAPPIGEHMASVLAGSSITCARKLSLPHSRNLRHGLCPATSSLQKIPRWFKTPVRTRAGKRETTAIWLYGASSTPSSWADGLYQTPTTLTSRVSGSPLTCTHKLSNGSSS